MIPTINDRFVNYVNSMNIGLAAIGMNKPELQKELTTIAEKVASPALREHIIEPNEDSYETLAYALMDHCERNPGLAEKTKDYLCSMISLTAREMPWNMKAIEPSLAYEKKPTTRIPIGDYSPPNEIQWIVI